MKREKSEMAHHFDEVTGHVTKYELVILLGQLHVLYEAGISIIRALRVLDEQATNPVLAKILRQLRNDIGQGFTLSRSMTRFPGVFDDVTLSVITVGEVVGDMGLILGRLAEFRRRELNLIRRVQAAMTYPLVVFACALILIILLAQFLFNSLIPVLQIQGAQLDATTRGMISLVTFLRHPAIMCFSIFLGAGFIYLGRQFLQSPFFMDCRDRYLWKAPLFGSTMRKIVMARFCYNLSLLHESGVSILKALAVTAECCGNSLMKEGIHLAIDSLTQGETLSEAFKRSGIFPPAFLHVVRAGESSGRLSHCLRQLAGFYETEVEYNLQNLASALEPVMISIMGVLVGGIIFFALSPLYKVIEGFGY